MNERQHLLNSQKKFLRTETKVLDAVLRSLLSRAQSAPSEGNLTKETSWSDLSDPDLLIGLVDLVRERRICSNQLLHLLEKEELKSTEQESLEPDEDEEV